MSTKTQVIRPASAEGVFSPNRETADIFVPDETPVPDAFARTTHMGILAHQDDLEIGAYHGITECFRSTEKWFAGVVVTDGGGSPRTGPYGDFNDEEMKEVRRVEQRKAAYIGEYAIQLQLSHPSSYLKSPPAEDAVEDLRRVLELAQPEVLYLHNPCDRHDTHVVTLLRTLEAIRRLPKEKRPSKAYGVEVWRKLDWLVADDKEMLPVDKFPNMASPLIGVFDSQISGGKRYDLAEEGLRRANATYFDSHTTDGANQMTFAMDLTPLMENDDLSVEEFAVGYVDRLRADVSERVKKYV